MTNVKAQKLEYKFSDIIAVLVGELFLVKLDKKIGEYRKRAKEDKLFGTKKYDVSGCPKYYSVDTSQIVELLSKKSEHIDYQI